MRRTAGMLSNELTNCENLGQVLCFSENFEALQRSGADQLENKDGQGFSKSCFLQRRTQGYKIVLRNDGSQFGLASNGFPHDKFPILLGWYGDLLTTFLGM